jgi:serine/threonine protein kinase
VCANYAHAQRNMAPASGVSSVLVDALDPYLDTVVADRYHIVRKLGEGGMSCVYEAKHLKLHRSFAIKVLLPSLLDNEEAQRRFVREAEMLAGLNHPNVVEISDFDTFSDGTPCMVLEYLHGATLRTRLARGPLAWDAIAKIGDQVMSALTLAHRNGITHRDLKPDNIFMAIDDVGEERVKLLDFGVSKLRGVGNMTGVFNMLGTPQYMSPEQASGESDKVGPSSDVWAMGAILYELATGRGAFYSESMADTLMKITTQDPDPIYVYRQDAPQQFVDLLDRTLCRDATRRIVDVEELRRGLKAALDSRNFQRAGGAPTAAAAGAPAAAAPLSGVTAVPIAPLAHVGSQPLVKATFQPPPALPGTYQPSGTTRVAPKWTKKRVLMIAGIVAVLVSGGAAAIAFAM